MKIYIATKYGGDINVGVYDSRKGAEKGLWQENEGGTRCLDDIEVWELNSNKLLE